MITWIHRCLIVPDTHVQFARDLCAAVAGPAGDGMYTTPLSATGQEPATHWISAGLISEDFAALLPLTIYPTDAEPIHRPGKPEAVAMLANEAGYETSTEAVQALFDASDVTEQDAQQAIARLGLSMLQPVFTD